MTLEDLGYDDSLEAFRIEHHLANFDAGRVIAEHRERYIVKTIHGEFESEITGNMRFAAKSREDFPAVGDWVALATYTSDFGNMKIFLPAYLGWGKQKILIYIGFAPKAFLHWVCTKGFFTLGLHQRLFCYGLVST